MTNTPGRPIMRYHGGKWRIAPWVISHFPEHRIYVEPFGGAGSVLLRKPRSFAEVYNDLDGDVVNVFRVLRDHDQAQRLRTLLELTPWSRQEFWLCYEPTDDPIERARRTIARSFMAHGSTHRRAHRTGFRAKNYRRNQTGAGDWRNFPGQIPAFVERLQGVTIECRPAIEIILQQDTADTLHYVDPPYVLNTRSSIRCQSERDGWRAYVHNLTDDEHESLAEVLRSLDGMVVLSGYPSPLYDELYKGWSSIERSALADGGMKRLEVLWLNEAAVERHHQIEAAL
ncbi:hypothetical protein LCGC14_2959050 [marine sediment metagenome]|uniref:Uncharacterized protein n=1 Tax=marine sediment metagenome TaxID=412755 RepID=A0A0F8Y088_9ZZZZ